jgi:hypothetical protein
LLGRNLNLSVIHLLNQDIAYCETKTDAFGLYYTIQTLLEVKIYYFGLEISQKYFGEIGRKARTGV